MYFVDFDPLGTQFIEFEDMSLKLALTRQLLEDIIKIVLKITVGHDIVDDNGVVLPELLLLRPTVDDRLAKHHQLMLGDILPSHKVTLH